MPRALGDEYSQFENMARNSDSEYGINHSPMEVCTTRTDPQANFSESFGKCGSSH